MASNGYKQKDELIGDPLNMLKIKISDKNGTHKLVEALSIGFMEKKQYIYYKSPPLNDNEKTLNAEEEEWLDLMSFYEEDLCWLLKLPHNRFWSQVIYDEDVHKFLESYLAHAYRDFDLPFLHLKEEISQALKPIHKRVFLVYLRMSTYKESKHEHIQPEEFGRLIYDYFLFDIPKMMDLSSLYGLRNQQLLSKMIQNVFQTQPSYEDDLDETSRILLTAFDSTEQKLFLNVSSERIRESSDLKEMDISELQDIVHFILDTAATISIFLDVYPPACQTFLKNNALNKIVLFYERVFPVIEKDIRKRARLNEYPSGVEMLKRKVEMAKTFSVKLFRTLIDTCYINKIVSSSVEGNSQKSEVELFLQTFTQFATEKYFLHDYNSIHPFESDTEFLSEMGIKLDAEQIDYILCSIHDTPEEIANKAAIENKVQLGALPLMPEPPKCIQEAASNSSQASPFETRVPSDAELESLIQGILDVFPHYGDGFIEASLKHYNYNQEKVIDELLTDSLPPSLNKMDRDAKREVKPNGVDFFVLSERRNIFDGDEFDVFSRDDVNRKNIHKGKSRKVPEKYESLNADKDSEFLKEMILLYGQAEEKREEEANLYEDEYDDTYDSAMVGLKEPDGDKEEESPENPDPSGRVPGPNDFCINPEILRAQAEQRRLSKARNKGGKPAANDTRTRQMKDRHKAVAGNHNRRQQSDFKKSRGMLPFPTR